MKTRSLVSVYITLDTKETDKNKIAALTAAYVVDALMHATPPDLDWMVKKATPDEVEEVV
jgi:hypothetical protein